MDKHILFLLILPFCFILQNCKTTLVSQPDNFSPNDITSFFKHTKQRPPMISAHRGGGYYEGYPENCLASFQHIIDSLPAIIECDVAMTQDSVLMLMHDKTLDRTTTGSGPIAERYTFELEPLFLVDHLGNTTGHKIPTLDQTLDWAKGKTILTLDIKRGVPMELVVDAIRKKGVEQNAIIITYNFEDSKKLYQIAPEIMQSVSIGSPESFEKFQATGIPFSSVIVFTGTREPSREVYKAIHKAGSFCILGTLGNLDKKAIAKGNQLYLEWIKNGADILATDRPFEAYHTIKHLIPEKSSHYQYLKP